MREITVEKDLAASRSAVWSVLADFPNISQWNSGVKSSVATSDSTEGVGARRHCDLAPAGSLEETIIGWEPDRRMVVRIDEAAKLPIQSAEVTFTLGDATPERTSTTVVYAYQPKFGPVGRLMSPLLDRQLRNGFEGFLADLERAAAERS